MYPPQLASGIPSALVDWHNNFSDDPDKCVLFHCGNWARSLVDEVVMGPSPFHESLGLEKGFGTVSGRAPPAQ